MRVLLYFVRVFGFSVLFLCVEIVQRFELKKKKKKSLGKITTLKYYYIIITFFFFVLLLVQIMMALRFYAAGTFQLVPTGDSPVSVCSGCEGKILGDIQSQLNIDCCTLFSGSCNRQH